MKKDDAVHLYERLTKYLSQFTVSPVFEKAEFTHWMGPVKGVVYSYVVENKDKKIEAFGSFYSLPSTIIGNAKYNMLNAAYLYYYFIDAQSTIKLNDLISDLLIQAKSVRVKKQKIFL